MTSEKDALNAIRQRRTGLNEQLQVARAMTEQVIGRVGVGQVSSSDVQDFVVKVGRVNPQAAQIAVSSAINILDPNQSLVSRGEINIHEPVRVTGGRVIEPEEFSGLVDRFQELRAGDRIQALAWREFDDQVSGF